MARPYNMPPEGLTNTMYDTDNPESMINIIPTRMIEVLHRIKPKMPRVLYCTEMELRKYVQPDERDERARLGFWDEYNHATAAGKKMVLAQVLHGLMSWETWITVFEPSDKKMMWVFCPPISYQVAMRNILHKGTERLMEIMSLPIIDDQGRPDSKVIVNILRAFQLVDIRVKGAVTQKLQIQQQTHNINQTIGAGDIHVATGLPVETLQLEELEKLERRIEKARKDSKRLVASLAPDAKEAYLAGINAEDLPKIGGSTMPQLYNEDLDAEIVLEGVTIDNK